MFYSVLFAGTFLGSTFSSFFLLRIVHCCDFYLVVFGKFFFLLVILFVLEDFLINSIENRSFWSKIHRRLIIVFIHFRYIERYNFCRRASIVLI